VSDPVTHTTMLSARDETVLFVSGLLAGWIRSHWTIDLTCAEVRRLLTAALATLPVAIDTLVRPRVPPSAVGGQHGAARSEDCPISATRYRRPADASAVANQRFGDLPQPIGLPLPAIRFPTTGRHRPGRGHLCLNLHG
jgi:hypothetical protein